MTKYLIALLVLLSFVLGFFFGIRYAESKIKTKVDSAVVLEKIKDILKIATVEANISEIYHHKDFQWFDLSPFRKTAIIRLQAKVLAGLDLDTSAISISEKDRTIHIIYNPSPKILSIDHVLDYYDLQQGTFNYFTPEELTALQADAKQKVTDKAVQAGVLNRAEERRIELFKGLQMMAEQMGYKLILSPKINSDSYKEIKK